MVKVLLVEDDRRIRVEVMAALAAEGLEVEVAVDLAGAEAMLGSGIDLVVLDRGLPDGARVALTAEVGQLVLADPQFVDTSSPDDAPAPPAPPTTPDRSIRRRT